MPMPPDAPAPSDPSPEDPHDQRPLEMTPDSDLVRVLEQLNAMEPSLTSMTPAEARDVSSSLFENSAPPPDTLEVTDHTIPGPAGPLAARLYRPKGRTPCPLFVAFHGGGWVLGSIAMYEGEACAMAVNSRCAVLSVDYRLAPEHPFPAAVDDAFAAVEWAHANAAALNCDPTRLGVAGSSSGGNLAAVCTILARDRGGPDLRHQWLVYPVTDCDFDRPTMLAFAKDLLLERDDMKWFWDHYCPERSHRTDFRASPLHAPSLVGLPSATIVLAALDPLLDEGLDYAARLSEGGTNTHVRVAPRMIHGFFGMAAHSQAAALEVVRACKQAGAALEASR